MWIRQVRSSSGCKNAIYQKMVRHASSLLFPGHLRHPVLGDRASGFPPQPPCHTDVGHVTHASAIHNPSLDTDDQTPRSSESHTNRPALQPYTRHTASPATASWVETCRQSVPHQIHHEPCQTAVAGVLKLADVLELIVHRVDQKPLSSNTLWRVLRRV